MQQRFGTPGTSEDNKTNKDILKMTATDGSTTSVVGNLRVRLQDIAAFERYKRPAPKRLFPASQCVCLFEFDGSVVRAWGQPARYAFEFSLQFDYYYYYIKDSEHQQEENPNLVKSQSISN